MRLLATFCLLLELSFRPALAEALPRTDLVCDQAAGVALVRFTLSEDNPPQYPTLPAAIDGGLSLRPGTDRTDCELSHGFAIRIREGEEQAFPYGAGGANPPAFFSLWIDRRKVLSRFVWKPGYDDASTDKPSLVGLVIRRDKLTFCFQKPNDKPITCNEQGLELRGYAIDVEEYAKNLKSKIPVGTFLVDATAANAAFCRRNLGVITRQPVDSNGLPFDSAIAEALTWTPRELDKNYAVGTAEWTFANVQGRRAVVLHGGNHYFDGEIVVFVPRDVSVNDVVKFLPDDDDLEREAVRPPPRDWTIISGGRASLYPKVSARYVHFVPEEIDGELYLIAFPTNHKERPSAVLVKPRPVTGFDSVCVYQRVEPHY